MEFREICRKESTRDEEKLASHKSFWVESVHPMWTNMYTFNLSWDPVQQQWLIRTKYSARSPEDTFIYYVILCDLYIHIYHWFNNLLEKHLVGVGEESVAFGTSQQLDSQDSLMEYFVFSSLFTASLAENSKIFGKRPKTPGQEPLSDITKGQCPDLCVLADTFWSKRWTFSSRDTDYCKKLSVK